MAKLEILTSAEQNKYFCLPPELAVWLKSVDSITSTAGFILLFGYCLAGARFYQPRQFYESDLNIIIICFLVHQYQLRQDIFADILLKCVKATENTVTKNEKQATSPVLSDSEKVQ